MHTIIITVCHNSLIFLILLALAFVSLNFLPIILFRWHYRHLLKLEFLNSWKTSLLDTQFHYPHYNYNRKHNKMNGEGGRAREGGREVIIQTLWKLEGEPVNNFFQILAEC